MSDLENSMRSFGWRERLARVKGEDEEPERKSTDLISFLIGIIVGIILIKYVIPWVLKSAPRWFP